MTNHGHNENNQPKGRQAAVELIRERIKSLYGEDEPAETKHASLVDRFWDEHSDHPSPQTAWEKYYDTLEDHEKTQLWNEYHGVPGTDSQSEPHKPNTMASSHSNSDTHSHSVESSGKMAKLHRVKDKIRDRENLKAAKTQLLSNVKSRGKSANPDPKLTYYKAPRNHRWTPLIFSVAAMALWLLAQYNPLLIAFAKQYVSPGDTQRAPVILDPNASVNVGPEPRIIIPKINVDVPVVYDVGTRDEGAIQAALEEGVVHYDGTSVPGEAGNNVIVGHSSNNFLNSGQYKFAFVLLERLEIDDTFMLHYEGTRYIYKVNNIQVVDDTDFSLTRPTATPTATLITCTPPGTSWKRLIVQAEQISPTVTPEQLSAPTAATEAPEDDLVPGNAPSFWQSLFD